MNKQPPAKKSPPSWPRLIIRASAGTGKTFRLSNRYLDLLAAGVPSDRILATTFTRKAAGEILDRILLRLATAATSDAERTKLASFLSANPFTQESCHALLEQTTRSLHRLRVSTLDSFFMAIAGSFSLELGLPPGWAIADTATDNQLRAQAIAETLDADDGEKLLTLFHRLAKGATTRGVHRMVQDAVDQLYDVYLEAPPEAWRQLQVAAGLKPEELNQLFDELESLTLPTAGMANARDTCLNFARAGDWESFVGKGLPSKIVEGKSDFNRKEIPADVIACITRILQHVKSVLLAPIVAHNEATYELLSSFHTHYDRLKRQRQALRFDDVTRAVAQSSALAQIDHLQHRLDGGLAHLLLDEFQDTSLAQWQVLRPFAHKVTAPEQPVSFFCVGDVKQAIYGWRGGLAQIFDALERELTGLERDELLQSFRSSPPVIETVNRIFTRMLHHDNLQDYEPAVRAWCANFSPHTTARTALPGYACLRTLPEIPADVSDDEFTDEYVAQYIQQLHEASPGREIGVLVRKNDTVRRIIFALRKLGIDASEEGGNALTDSAAVGLILSLLRLADHPGDTVARYHLLKSPLSTELGLTAYQDNVTAARISQRLRSEILSSGYGAWTLRWAKAIAPHCNRRELSRLDQLVELAYRYRPSDPLRADRFAELVAEEKVSDPSAAPVRVMNVHQSKGLQFEIVVLPELDARLLGMTDAFATGRPGPTETVNIVCRHVNKDLLPFLPANFQRLFEAAKEEHLREALCVLYVALTRAVYALHILIGYQQGSSKSSNKTFAGLLRGALCDNRILPGDEVAYECGDPNWCAKLEPPPEARTRVAPPSPEPLAIRLLPAADGRRRGWQSVSPSQLEGGPSKRMKDVLRPARDSGENFGTLIHAWLARYQWLGVAEPDDATLTRIALEEVQWPGDPSTEIKQLRAWLAQPTLQEILDEHAYRAAYGRAFARLKLSDRAELQVQCEQRFAHRAQRQLATGSIDRLVLWQEQGKIRAADILDYKTDAISPEGPAALAAKVEYYRPQLAAYVQAVAQRYQLPPERITARLVFLSAGKIVDVSAAK